MAFVSLLGESLYPRGRWLQIMKTPLRALFSVSGMCLKPSRLTLCLALAGGMASAGAEEPRYPALPPTLSTSVAPNVMLYIDTSGSMLENIDNSLDLLNRCVGFWMNCINSNMNNYRTLIDRKADTKMNIAKRAALDLVRTNSETVRFGVFSFEDKDTTGGTERGEAGVLRAPVQDVSKPSGYTSVNNAILRLNGRTSTPLAEGLLEVTRYFEGKTSLYSKRSGAYTSPIQYRCQKNFALVITDGDATDDGNLPGNNDMLALPYTARDSQGLPVSRNFSICKSPSTAASDDTSVDCPAKLEGETAKRDFGNDRNRPSALRDVAKYARIADLRVGGKDLDGKSFDDPQFAKQNLITYTIGFSTTNPVLEPAAKAGGGKYKATTNGPELAAALKQAIDSIIASSSNGGGLGVIRPTSGSGNQIFQPVFNPSNWTGELRCFSLADGAMGSACTPNAKAVIPAPANRKVYSSKVDTSGTTAFDFHENTYEKYMSGSQARLLGGNDAEIKNTIQFVRGVEGIDGLRSRNGILLGDIVDGQPIVVTAPSGYTPDAGYAGFKSTNAARNMVLVGANDGMMHAFKTQNMTELMGYIPSPVYPGLKALTATDYGQSAGTPHAYHVNGVMKQQDMKLSTGWKTIVVGGLGQGGQGYYALDATNETQLGAASSAVKWEFTDISDSSMGYTLGAPLLYNVRATDSTVTPAVIFANGYENDFDDTDRGGKKPASKSSALFILNADTGAVIKKIEVKNSTTGLSSPVGVDVGQDGILDYVYAGDLNGNLWRFDLTNSNPDKFKVIDTPIFQAGAGQPIVMRPVTYPVSKASDDTSLGNIVIFGTGKLLTNSDRTNTATQALYGILDTMEAEPTTVTREKLQQQNFDAVTATLSSPSSALAGASFRKISENEIDLTADANQLRGWYVNLPEKSERLITTPQLLKDIVMFGTAVPISPEKCLPGGKGWVIGLNPLTGSITRKDMRKDGKKFSFIDTNGDNKSSKTDMLKFGTEAEYVSAYSTGGIPTELTIVGDDSVPKLVGPDKDKGPYGDAGAVVALTDFNTSGVFNGNTHAKGVVTTGNAIKVPETPCKASMFSGTVGNDTISKVKVNCAGADAVRVTSTTWREIK